MDDRARPHALRLGVSCPYCLSHERHRALVLYLSRHREVLAGARSILHFAPEYPIAKRLRALPGVRYVGADLGPSPLAPVAADIQALPFGDGEFDLIVCSHVLEHVDDDAAALCEIRRVLAPGGRALVMVPVDRSRATTYEDPALTTPADRDGAFWQPDHVRLYGLDAADRFARSGMTVETESVRDWPPTTIARHGLSEIDDIYICRR